MGVTFELMACMKNSSTKKTYTAAINRHTLHVWMFGSALLVVVVVELVSSLSPYNWERVHVNSIFYLHGTIFAYRSIFACLNKIIATWWMGYTLKGLTSWRVRVRV